MLITVPIEELKPGDVLQPDNDMATFSIVRDAMAVPTHTERTNTLFKLQWEAKRVKKLQKSGRLYASVTMGTYVVVTRKKGTPVHVDRDEENGPEDVSAVVAGAAEIDEYADKPADFVDEDGCAPRYGNRPERSGPTQSQYEDSIPDGTDSDIENRPAPFNYVTSQFNRLTGGGPYRIKITSESGETNWLHIHDADLSALQILMEAREES